MLDVEKLIAYLDEMINTLESKDIKPGSFQDGSVSAFRSVRLLVKNAMKG